MIEVEIKLPVREREEIRSGLLNLGFVLREKLIQVDTYYDNKEGQIRGNGEALRIRTITTLSPDEQEMKLEEYSVITYKGKKLDQISMTRQELETEIKDAQVIHGILNALGYASVNPIVRKKRDEYEQIDNHMHACLDHVEGLGEFLELEMMAEEGRDSLREEMLDQIQDILHKLGYSMEDTTRTSYLSMLQRRLITDSIS